MKTGVLSISFMLLAFLSMGQDGLYSQPFQSGVLLNPALIGNSEVQTRVGGVYRTQWKIEEAPYENYGLFFESKVKAFKYGLVLNQSKTGDVGFKRTSVLLSTGLTKKLGTGNNKLSFGAQFGLYQMKIQQQELQFDNQYNPLVGFDETLASREEFSTTNLIKPDINIGLAADFQLKSKLNIDGQIGLSIIHINTPGTTFNKEDVYQPMNTILHAKAFIHFNKQWGLEPILVFSNNEIEREYKVGVNAGFSMMDNFLKFGIASDLDGIFTFLSQFEVNKFAIGLSIDANIGNAQQSISDNNTFELSLIYNLPKKSYKTSSRDILR